MANLFPVGYENEVITSEDLKRKSVIGYRNGVAFSEKTGDFIRDGKNKILDSTGVESWRSWCINCIQTERYKHLAYSTDFGIEIDTALRASSREEAESILTREVTEALLADPYGRTAYIDEIEFDWTAPDSIKMSAKIHGIDEVTIDITAYITKGDI